MDDDLTCFLRAEQLPKAFRRTLRRVCHPLAAMATRAQGAGPMVIGLCGAQGSGKSTIAEATVRLLRAQGRQAIALSLDDFYLPGAKRRALAREIHPLLAVRGPPGTHDVALACDTLNQLAKPGRIRVPKFDKAADEPLREHDWPAVEGPVEVVILEGWCVGAREEPAGRVARPINDLERTRDTEGRWRRFVNDQLAAAYPPLFNRLDLLALLAAPDFDVVFGWRLEQEQKLRARSGAGMTQAEIAHFIQHYERVTRWLLEDMPRRADWLVTLEADRTVVATKALDPALRQAPRRAQV